MLTELNIFYIQVNLIHERDDKSELYIKVCLLYEQYTDKWKYMIQVCLIYECHADRVKQIQGFLLYERHTDRPSYTDQVSDVNDTPIDGIIYYVSANNSPP
jgi:hypothetical protein